MGGGGNRTNDDGDEEEVKGADVGTADADEPLRLS